MVEFIVKDIETGKSYRSVGELLKTRINELRNHPEIAAVQKAALEKAQESVRELQLGDNEGFQKVLENYYKEIDAAISRIRTNSK